MTANKLIKLIPEEIFSSLALETKVDYQVKKLSGEVVFKLILFSMLNTSKLSLRVMEGFLQSSCFKAFCGPAWEGVESKYNSIRDRICTINGDYFEKLFTQIFAIYNKELKEEKALSKVDSTYVSLSAKLFAGGMQNGDTSKRQVKYSVNLKGSLPATVKIFTAQSYISESLALPELIDQCDYLQGDIVVFDRGIQTRKAFDKFTSDNKFFIGRSKTSIKCKIVCAAKVNRKPANATLTIISDEQCILFKDQGKKAAHIYRVIRAMINKSEEEICLITNIMDEDAYTIAQWYKQRWEIEVFFKFIKQHLNASHLVSRTDNGMKVMIYMTMIVAVLLLAYKKINKIKGYKIAKLRFEVELENEIIKTIVILCGGDPNNAMHLFESG